MIKTKQIIVGIFIYSVFFPTVYFIVNIFENILFLFQLDRILMIIAYIAFSMVILISVHYLIIKRKLFFSINKKLLVGITFIFYFVPSYIGNIIDLSIKDIVLSDLDYEVVPVLLAQSMELESAFIQVFRVAILILLAYHLVRKNSISTSRPNPENLKAIIAGIFTFQLLISFFVFIDVAMNILLLYIALNEWVSIICGFVFFSIVVFFVAKQINKEKIYLSINFYVLAPLTIIIYLFYTFSLSYYGKYLFNVLENMNASYIINIYGLELFLMTFFEITVLIVLARKLLSKPKEPFIMTSD